MKVLQINSVCGIGSTGRICTDIASFLTDNGEECRIAYGRGEVPERYRKYAVRIGGSPSVYVHAALSRIGDLAGFSSRNATVRFLKWVKAYDPDIVHLHNLHGYYINLPQLFSYLKQAKKPVVMTLHDAWSFTGHCAHFDLCGCQRWVDKCRNCPQKKEYPTSFYDGSQRNFLRKQKLFTSLDKLTVVTPSEWLASLARRSYLAEYDIKVINNGIDTEIFRPTESDIKHRFCLDNKSIVLGVASVWTEKKGFYDMLKLAKMLPPEWHTVIIGKVPININSQRVTVIPETQNVLELTEWYSAAEVLVNPTYEDTFPTVNLESQSCGTPVVTYPTGGSPESIISGKTGYVTREKTPDAVLDVIVSGIKKNTDMCRRNALRYDKRHRFEEYVGEYRALLLARENQE